MADPTAAVPTAAFPAVTVLRPVVLEGELVPTVGYSILWPLLGFLLLVGIAAWFALTLLLTRRRSVVAPVPVVRPSVVEAARARCLAEIAEVRAAVERGETSPRRAHHQLSRSVRSFVSTANGLHAERMTLEDLRAVAPPHLVDLVERFYPAQFGTGEPSRTTDAALGSADAATQLVRGWRA